MAIGQGVNVSFPSYLALIRESTYGTYVTAATAGLEFISCSLKTMKQNKIIEEVTTYRVMNDTIGLGRTIEGDIEHYFDPRSTAACFLFQNALGGAAITSATATGETAGGAAFTHVIGLGDFNTGTASLSANVRKGDSDNAKIFEFSGLRVNEMVVTAELDEPLKITYSLIGKDSSLTTNDVSSQIGVLNQSPLSFVNGRLSLEGTFASLTSTSYWHVQNMEFTISNNLKSDESSRRIGSDTIEVLPPGVANMELTFTIRFDTNTAYNYMLNNTKIAGEFEFLGDTLSTSIIRQGLKVQFPKLVVTEASDPEISGPDEVLTQEVKCIVLRDVTSATGYAVKAYVTNGMSSF
jgi:hypothetical protein